MKMSEFFRSKSCQITAAGAINSFSTPGILKSSSVHTPSRYHHHHKEKEEEDEEEEDTLEEEYLGDNSKSPATTPFSGLEERRRRRQNRSSSMNHLHHRDCNANDDGNHFPEGPGGIMGIVVAALRKSFLVTCSGLDVDMDIEVSSSNTVMDIGWPTAVRHVSHVTFDPFHGFLGLPFDLQYHPPTGYALPSAGSNATVFGVSPQSMQCSYDHRGYIVPTILLMMQNRLYSEGSR